MNQLLVDAPGLLTHLGSGREAESTSVPAKLIIAHAANNSPEQ